MLNDEESVVQLLTVLENHGIHIDQVDKDQDGRDLYRWWVDTGYVYTGLELWHTPAKALDAALTYLFSD